MSNTLSALSLSNLAAIFNQYSPKLINKFSSKAEAVKRTQAILEVVGVTPEEAAAPYQPASEPVAAVTEPEVVPVAAPAPLTNLQFGVLNEMAHSEFTQDNGSTPDTAVSVNVWFWPDEMAKELGITEHALGGVVASLVNAGLVEVHIVSKKDKKRYNDESTIAFTQAGFDAWQADFKAGRKYEAAPVKAKKAKAATGGKRGPAPKFADTAKITVLVANPKRPGSASFARFAKYQNEMTVAEFLAAGGKREDLTWDIAHAFISVA